MHTCTRTHMADTKHQTFSTWLGDNVPSAADSGVICLLLPSCGHCLYNRLMTPDQLCPFEQIPGSSGSGLNMNLYATKKTVAEGMLDVALFLANVTHMKTVIEQGAGYR